MANGNGARRTHAGLWRAARLVALVATVAVIVGLFAEPKPTLRLLWGLIIPLVPASLLVSPMLWRNVCPLATLNMPPSIVRGRRSIDFAALTRLAVLGMVLLAVLVSARHVTFNGFNPTDGTVLGITVVAVAVAALALGFLFNAKVGFCNSFCPVLPVERLYGQSPLLRVGNARCSPCSRCTDAGCIDLGPDRSIAQILEQAPPKRPWFLTSFGVFAAAFPGFVLGYNLADDGPLSTTAEVFVRVGLYTGLSFLVVAGLAAVGRVSARRAMPALAAAAVGIYYWFAGPVIARAVGLQDPAPSSASVAAVGIRAAAFALAALWLWSAWAPPRATCSVPAGGAGGNGKSLG